MNDITVNDAIIDTEQAPDSTLFVNLTVSDPETVAAIQEHAEGRARTQYLQTALKVGVMALRAARGTVDAAAVRNEGERLVTQLAERLERHRELVDSEVTRALRVYFDPSSGAFTERVGRLVAEDGDLAGLIQRKVTEASRSLDVLLAEHLGAESPLLAMLSPSDGNQLIGAIRTTVDSTARSQAEAVIAQFSLDNRDGALRRLLDELAARHGDLQTALAHKVETVVAEFSLDKEDSALSRLVGQVRNANEQITRQFSLDDSASGLSRLMKVISDHHQEQTQRSHEFQTRVLTLLERIDVRRAEQARSTAHGNTFQADLGTVLAKWAEQSGDIFEDVADRPGTIPRNKTGDFVLTLSPDSAAAGARIVVEAKESAAYRLQTTLDEADEARRNRDAGVCLFVHSRRAAPSGQAPLARYGQDIVVVWDAQDETSDVVLQAGWLCAKAMSVRAGRQSAEAAASLAEIDQAIETVRKHASGFDEIRKFAETIRSSAGKIDDRARIMSDAIARQIEALAEHIGRMKSAGS